MGWTKDGAEDHEGFISLVLRDSRESASTTGGGVLLMRPAPEQIEAAREAGWTIKEARPGDPATPLYVVAPWTEVVAWRSACDCGWRGRECLAWANEERGTRDCPEHVTDLLMLDWSEHVQPIASVSELREMHAQEIALRTRMSETVKLARVHGVSWAEIGRATGRTRQGAAQRWAGPAEASRSSFAI